MYGEVVTHRKEVCMYVCMARLSGTLYIIYSVIIAIIAPKGLLHWRRNKQNVYMDKRKEYSLFFLFSFFSLLFFFFSFFLFF